jgi:hypothetical protein
MLGLVTAVSRTVDLASVRVAAETHPEDHADATSRLHGITEFSRNLMYNTHITIFDDISRSSSWTNSACLGMIGNSRTSPVQFDDFLCISKE